MQDNLNGFNNGRDLTEGVGDLNFKGMDIKEKNIKADIEKIQSIEKRLNSIKDELTLIAEETESDALAIVTCEAECYLIDAIKSLNTQRD